MNVFELTKSLMNIPSVSGEEAAVGFCREPQNGK